MTAIGADISRVAIKRYLSCDGFLDTAGDDLRVQRERLQLRSAWRICDAPASAGCCPPRP